MFDNLQDEEGFAAEALVAGVKGLVQGLPDAVEAVAVDEGVAAAVALRQQAREGFVVGGEFALQSHWMCTGYERDCFGPSAPVS
jgi:hypothetical protein